MDEDQLLDKYRRSVGQPTLEEAVRIELEGEIEAAALEVRSRFSSDLLRRLNKITAPNDVSGITELCQGLGKYVVFARMGNVKARVQEKQRTGLKPVGQAIGTVGTSKMHCRRFLMPSCLRTQILCSPT